MFGELFEKMFRLDENEKLIRTIYKIYKDHERGLDPDESDLDIALEGMEAYYREYISWWTKGYGKAEPINLKKAYHDRHDEIVDALASKSRREKIIAVDNAINQWHVDYPVIGHLEMEAAMDDEEGEREEEMEQIVTDTMEILKRLGRLPEESPYSRR